MNISIIGNDTIKYHRLVGIIRNKGFSVNEVSIKDIRKTKTDICIIFDQDYPGLHKLIEGLVYEEQFPIVYVSAKHTYLHNVENSAYFYMIDEKNAEYDIIPVISILYKTANELLKIKTEFNLIKDKFEEEKLVSRAKIHLIESKGISEKEAHKYIQEESMAKRLPKSIVAKRILE